MHDKYFSDNVWKKICVLEEEEEAAEAVEIGRNRGKLNWKVVARSRSQKRQKKRMQIGKSKRQFD